MKQKTLILTGALTATAAVALLTQTLTGCASTPSALETKLYDIKTNVVANVVLSHGDGTNRVWVTNYSEIYEFTPNTNSAKLREVAGRVGGLFGPFGDLASVLLGGAIGGWGVLRSHRANRLAGVLAQVIETGRQVLQTTPQGRQLDAQWKEWMIEHEAEQGVIQDVMALLTKAVDNESAKRVADQLVTLMHPKPAAPAASSVS